MIPMIPSVFAPVMKHVARGYPLLAIANPRQSGKRRHWPRMVFGHLPYTSLGDPLEQAAFDADPRAWLARYPDSAVLGEVQRVPDRRAGFREWWIATAAWAVGS